MAGVIELPYDSVSLSLVGQSVIGRSVGRSVGRSDLRSVVGRSVGRSMPLSEYLFSMFNNTICCVSFVFKV